MSCTVEPLSVSPELCGKLSFSVTHQKGSTCKSIVYKTKADEEPPILDALLIQSIQDGINFAIDPDYVFVPPVDTDDATLTLLLGGTPLVIEFENGTVTYDGNPVPMPAGTFIHGGNEYTITVDTVNNTITLSADHTGIVYTSANQQIGPP